MDLAERVVAMVSEACRQWLPLPYDTLGQIPSHPVIFITLVGFTGYYLTGFLTSWLFRVKVPYVGYRSTLEPT